MNLPQISLQHSARWLNIANALTYMWFCLPVLVLLYQDKGVTLGDFFLIRGISYLFIFITEIPTGYIGDIFSRKHTVMIGFSMWIFGYLLWLFGAGFWILLAGELFFALAAALVSGTIEAYLYDLLKKQNKEHAFHKKLAKSYTIKNIAGVVSTFAGAFLYRYTTPSITILASIACLTIAIIITSLLPDVPESKRMVEKGKSKWQDILDISKFAMKHHEIKWLIMFPAFCGPLTFLLLWGLQPVMINQHMPVIIFSVVVGAERLMRTFWSAVSGKLLDKFHLSGVIRILLCILVLSSLTSCVAVYVPVWLAYICLAFMVVGSASYPFSDLAVSVLINHRIQSDERATVLSVKSMVDFALSGVAMICLKPLFDTIGTGQTLIVGAVILLPIILLSGFHLYKMHLTTQA